VGTGLVRDYLLEASRDVQLSRIRLKSVSSPEILEILLQHELCCEITPDILETLASHHHCGLSLVKVLLDQEPRALPTSDVVVSVLTSASYGFKESTDVMTILQSLLDCNPSISVSETMITACKQADHLRILLSRPYVPNPE
jgi:hypothetical protein